MSDNNWGFPRLMLSFKAKTKAWRKLNILWGANKTFFNYAPVRNSVHHMMINYNLLNGKLSMQDLKMIINPDDLQANYIPDKIQHYSLINSKLNVLRGEETSRVFDFKVIVTNPTQVAEIEENKKNALLLELQLAIEDLSSSEDEFNEKLLKINDYFTYNWQDIREIRANALLNHYVKEYNMPELFNQGFMDGMAVGEEIYLCDIVGGEPVIERVNPLKIRVFKSGYSNKIEDADIIILEDYWNPGRVIDTYYDQLSLKDMDYIEKMPDMVGTNAVDEMGNIDERYGFVNSSMISDEITASGNSYYFDPGNLFGAPVASSLLPFDLAGNIRVMRMYWKSKRKILKVKSYDPETGEELFTFYPENYIVDKDAGEEAETYWINEAWEGTLIGDAKDGIYVNMRPRPVLYNRLSNPSRCHFGIVGSIYNLNDNKPFSMVDMMKPYNYLYDAIHDRLNKALASNWGSILELDLSKVPTGWDIDKWMYYAKINHIAVIDSFKEGNAGAATGKLAGALNNAGKGIIETNIGNYIQLLINLLEFIKMEMSEVVGITKLREGLISNRETVGGVERSTLLSSHITEWLFQIHDDVKKRALECFLETAKIALKGKSKKFQYILSDTSMKVMDIPGDEFAECDYGLVVDNSQSTQQLQQQLDTLAQAALLTQTLSFSTIMKLYTSSSLAEKQRLVETDENKLKEMQQQQQQEQLLAQQQAALMQQETAMALMQHDTEIHNLDNETKVLIALINALSNQQDGIQEQPYDPLKKEELLEKVRQFDQLMKLENRKLDHLIKKDTTDAELKRKQLSILANRPKVTSK